MDHGKCGERNLLEAQQKPMVYVQQAKARLGLKIQRFLSGKKHDVEEVNPLSVGLELI